MSAWDLPFERLWRATIGCGSFDAPPIEPTASIEPDPLIQPFGELPERPRRALEKPVLGFQFSDPLGEPPDLAITAFVDHAAV